jgi:asparagine synthetase B (glutamine-hydrolysing)
MGLPQEEELAPVDTLQQALSSPEMFAQLPADLVQSVMNFHDTLSHAVHLRLHHLTSENHGRSRVAVLFSGGIDCTCIALLVHQHLPPEECIDLLNVAFENPRTLQANKQTVNMYDVPDRKTGRLAYVELKRLAPHRRWNFVQVDVPYEQVVQHTPHIRTLQHPSSTLMDFVRIQVSL